MPAVFRAILLCTTVTMACLFPASDTLSASERKPFVSLILSEASARSTSDGGTRFICKITLDNATAGDLIVQSRFHSVFDGLELVVTDIDGKVLAQQDYTYHQSPHSLEPRQFVVKQGSQTQTIIFPLSDFSAVGERLKVRLVGFLPGSTYRHILSTETKELAVQRPGNDSE